MKSKVIVLKKFGNVYKKVAEKKLKVDKDEIFSYENKAFPFTEKCSCYQIKNTSYYFIDYENEKFITFNENGIGIDANFLDKFLTTTKVGIIGQLINAIRLDMKNPSNWKEQMKPIFYIVIGGIIGFLIGNGGLA